MRPFLVDDDALELDAAAAAKHLTSAILPVLARLADTLEASASLDVSSAEHAVRTTAERAGVKAAALIHATRVAVTGRAVSAGLFEVLTVMGAARVIRRIRRAVEYTPGG
jgi:glutamyl-tRNA synthetase